MGEGEGEGEGRGGGSPWLSLRRAGEMKVSETKGTRQINASLAKRKKEQLKGSLEVVIISPSERKM